MRCLNLFVQNIFQMNSKSLKIRIKISIQPWMKIIFLIVAYFIGQQNAYKEKYKPEKLIMPKVRDLTAFRVVIIDHGPSLGPYTAL